MDRERRTVPVQSTLKCFTAVGKETRVGGGGWRGWWCLSGIPEQSQGGLRWLRYWVTVDHWVKGELSSPTEGGSVSKGERSLCWTDTQLRTRHVLCFM